MSSVGFIRGETFDHFFQDTLTETTTKQMVADLVLSGETGITLPGGNVGFAIGGQFRKNNFDRRYNDVSNLASFPCPGSPLNPAAM